MMAQTVYTTTSAIWGGGYFLTPPRQTNKSNWGVKEMNWGVEPPIPRQFPHCMVIIKASHRPNVEILLWGDWGDRIGVEG